MNANTLPEVLNQGDMVQYYREMCAKEKHGWRGPAKDISSSGKDVTMMHDKEIIFAHYRDVRKFEMIPNSDGEFNH